MAVDVLPVQSDPTLLADIRRYGKFDSTGCYQCGSCTLTCDLVAGSATFPRRTIRCVLLGLRQPLVENLDPWVCHDCGDCSIACPRQSEPGVSMMTLRLFLSAQYEWTGISSKLLRSTAWYLGSLILVAAFTMLLIVSYHLWYVRMPARDFATTPLGLEHMFPLITYYTLTVMLLPLLLLLSRVVRIWRLTMTREGQQRIPLSAYAAQAWVFAYESFGHATMRKCLQPGRWTGHYLLALGTSMMLFIKVLALRWFQTDNIYPLYHPQRWLGYLAAGFIVYGVADIGVRRWRAHREIGKETCFRDLAFPALLLMTALSGIAVHVFRYAGFALTCHYLYAMHVVIATDMLVVEMSFGKWSHMIYRPLALYLLSVRERVNCQALTAEVVSHAL